MKPVDIVCGYQFPATAPRAVQGLSSNSHFTGVRLRDVLRRVGVDDRAREVVFFGADQRRRGRGVPAERFEIQQQFARSITLENATKPEPVLAYALNGEPLDAITASPLRVMMPGWYRVADVMAGRSSSAGGPFSRRLQARWYRTLRAVGGSGRRQIPKTQFVETMARLNLKSVVARVRKAATGDLGSSASAERRHAAAIRRGEGGRRAMAAGAFDPANTRYSWKLFTLPPGRPTPGEHTSCRASPTDGLVQPTAAELARKRTFLEDNWQFPRKVKVA